MRLLIVSNQTIKKKMAGPAIRYFNIYNYFKSKYNCKLLSPKYREDYKKDKNIQKLNLVNFVCNLMKSDVIISQPSRFSYLLLSRLFNKKIVIDLYDPMDIENLEMYKNINSFKVKMKLMYTHLRLKFSLLIGDYFLCANETQRDYWIGYLSAIRRVNKNNYEKDDKLINLIGYMPYGISEEIPMKNKNVIKGVIEGIYENDIVLIWAGGIWNWFDTESLIKAVNKIHQENNNVKLLFLGVPKDYLYNEKYRKVKETIELSDRLGATNKSVFFNMDWVDYDERHNYLLESDIGISTHFDHMETRYSFRTRILDYLWSNLPFITSDKDYFAQLCNEKKLGCVANCNDYISIYENIKVMLDNDYINECKKNILNVKEKFFWQNCFKELEKYCENTYQTDGKLNKINSIIFVLICMIKIIFSGLKR